MTASKEPKTASVVTRMFFERLDRTGVQIRDLAEQCGVHVNTLYYWKSGKIAATVINMETALSVLGLELAIRPIQKLEPGELPQ
jgi:hypothetical protein